MATYRRALFLDRDGVINIDHGYVHRPAETCFIDGIFDLVGAARRAGYTPIVVTNQAGIGRGYYSEDEFHTYMDWMRGIFAAADAPLDAVYFCPHHPTAGQGPYRKTCQCRKPEPGLIFQAQADQALDLSNSILIGDKSTDQLAAKRAGIPTRILLTTSINHAADATHVFDTLGQVQGHLFG